MGLEPQAVLGHPLSAKEQSSFAGTAGLKLELNTFDS
jgi:hypothetical protein